jgi:hypothetical protein
VRESWVNKFGATTLDTVEDVLAVLDYVVVFSASAGLQGIDLEEVKIFKSFALKFNHRVLGWLAPLSKAISLGSVLFGDCKFMIWDVILVFVARELDGLGQSSEEGTNEEVVSHSVSEFLFLIN